MEKQSVKEFFESTGGVGIILLQLALIATPFLVMGWATQPVSPNAWPKPDKKMVIWWLIWLIWLI